MHGPWQWVCRGWESDELARSIGWAEAPGKASVKVPGRAPGSAASPSCAHSLPFLHRVPTLQEGHSTLYCHC